MIGKASVRVLLISPHDWFASALEAVLEPEGFAFARVSSLRHALRHVEQSEPELVILAERLPEIDAPGLIRALRDGGLPDCAPIVVYSPNFWHEAEQAAAMAAGAWDILREPLRPAMIVARLRRLLEIRSLIRTMEEGALAHAATGTLTLGGLMRCMRPLEATAERHRAPLSCVVVGPTEPGIGASIDAQRDLAATICRSDLRGSDLCGYLGDADFGIVAYGTTAAGVTALVRRLNQRLAEAPRGEGVHRLSAGVVEFSGSTSSDDRGRDPSRTFPRVTTMSRLVAAQAALKEARASGGGIRIAQQG